ncbi:hypothetical protein PF005_g20444 [Phytophthora fragariae]|uniref:WLGC domain-containing protein n=1 Tax=Phytophthora fragariae TaxID=53985 RepID=A0A6A4CPV7_9STRA|nr:hypothetical protein PF009_g16632 [Phytophthora fragariae]KAE8987494.1 hypothetical protein PF011_g19557 [Phytophthora fragariae]KAE9087851.1 hypothetical protein PF010_g19577 [Phytophthora fragariae]KAE9099337.1 hypothetical protein PF007_g15916 [Phytophthora fragariae]KAE9114355.1 hypothetical protein PF006_g19543 [Phytophthora fragariae]
MSASFVRPRKVPNSPTAHRLTFWQAFGLLGIPMLLFLLISIVWTAWLIIMTLAPNETATYLMNTGDYDDGQFWLLLDQDIGIKLVRIFGLSAIEVGYFHILVKMLFWRTIPAPIAAKVGGIRRANTEDKKSAVLVRRKSNNLTKFWEELTEINGTYRKIWNLVHKVADLTTQVVLLSNYLEKGFPDVLVDGWAAFISANCLSCVHNILLDKHSALAEILVDSISTTMCSAQVELFRVNFNSPRDQTPLLLLIHLLMNWSFLNRFKAVVEVLVRTNRRLVYPRRHTKIQPRQQCRVPKPFALFFMTVSALLVPYVHVAIQASRTACSPYDVCLVYAYRFPWTSATKGVCPCRTLIDIDRAPRTFDEWINPVDVTNEVKILASSGDLKVLRLINRQLMELPTELKNCQLEHLSLIYTSTNTFPDRTSQWKSLEFLHVEGKQGSENLVYLPNNLFSEMPHLVFLHLALHKSLDKFPALDGTPKLQTIELAHLIALAHLPDLDKTLNLRGIVIAYLPLLETLPDLLHLKHLISLTVFRPSFLCCNGYLGHCNLTHPFCAADTTHNFPAATCLTDNELPASPAMLNLLARFGSGVCYKTPENLLEFADTPTKASVDSCGGVAYRRCEILDPTRNETLEGMCYNLRMQVISCNPDPNNMAVRRLQIKLNVGTPCNVVEEAWLGCGISTN